MISPIPAEFVLKKKTALTLPEVRWALENGLIGAEAVVTIATALAVRGDVSPIVAALASTTHADLAQVSVILSGVPIHDEELPLYQRKWLWIVLSHVHELHANDPGVFETIDEIYQGFEYPDEMRTFGPYAPAYQVKGDPLEQRQAVLGQWERYLARGDAEFANRTSPSGAQ